MSVLDLSIIYLACGAPLSMHYFFGFHRKPTVYFIFGGIAVTLFWPIAALLFAVNASLVRAKRITDPRITEIDGDLDVIRIRIENLAFENENATSVFEFREVFARYSGLIQASNGMVSESDTNEIFRISRHANSQLATKCLNRNAAARLMSHADRAQRDFIDFTTSIVKNEKSMVLPSLMETAAILGDNRTLDRLRQLTERKLPTNSGDSEKVRHGVTEPMHTTLS